MMESRAAGVTSPAEWARSRSSSQTPRREAGALVAAGSAGESNHPPGEGVELAGGDRIRHRSWSPTPIRSSLLGSSVQLGGLRRGSKRVESVPITGCTVKLNAALSELPNFKARPGTREPHHLATINTPITKPEWKDVLRRGECRPAAEAAVDRDLPADGVRPERGAPGDVTS